MIDIQEHLEHSTPRSRKGDGRSVYYDCPFCGGEGKLEYDPKGKKGQIWCCHKCKESGLLSNQGFSTQGNVSDTCHSVWTLDDFSPMKPREENGCLTPGWWYLRDIRGFPMELIEDLHPHYGPEMYRVYFPLYQLGQTEPCYFVGRWIFQTTPDKPYINHPIAGTKRSEIVWGLHRFPRPKKRVVVCEGILDAIWGDDRVATLGKSVNPMQAKLIATLATDEIILMPDGDAVANAMTTLETILQFWAGPVSLIRLPFDVDPGDLHEDIDMSKRERLV